MIADPATTHNRTMPKVPGLNAQQLGPSIGTDHWRTDTRQKNMRNAQVRKPGAYSGRSNLELVPVRKRKPRKLSRSQFAPLPNKPRAGKVQGRKAA